MSTLFGPPIADSLRLSGRSEIHIKQFREAIEIVGFEARNRYAVEDSDGNRFAFVIEQSSGILGTIMRQIFGHWRTFELHLFDSERTLIARAIHPFRWFFQRMNVVDAQGAPVGSLQQRWSWTCRYFEALDPGGRLVMTVESPWLRFWTFRVLQSERDVAVIEKRWSGLLKETFLDSDNFRIRVYEPTLGVRERILILMSGVFVDLQYFEKKAGK